MDKVDTKVHPKNKDIKIILQQNSYTNQLVYVFSNKILEVDTKTISNDKPSSSYTE